jgi:lipopolysaccharide export system protein LptA
MPLSRTLMAVPLLAAALGFTASAKVLAANPLPEPAPGTAPNPAAQPAPGTTATQAGVVTIESDRQQADNATGIVTATGNVRIVYPDRKVVATSRQAQYFSREARVVLSGDVQVLQEGGNRLLAEQVVYDVSNERVDARPFPGAQVVSIIRMRRSTSAMPTNETPVPAPKLPAP